MNTNIPKTIEECVIELDKILSQKDKEWIKECAEENSVIGGTHNNIGRWIRNNWGLWKNNSKLYDYLKSLGFLHPDDMSSIIIYFYWKHIRGESWTGLEEKIEEYRKWWSADAAR